MTEYSAIDNYVIEIISESLPNIELTITCEESGEIIYEQSNNS